MSEGVKPCPLCAETMPPGAWFSEDQLKRDMEYVERLKAERDDLKRIIMNDSGELRELWEICESRDLARKERDKAIAERDAWAKKHAEALAAVERTREELRLALEFFGAVLFGAVPRGAAAQEPKP